MRTFLILIVMLCSGIYSYAQDSINMVKILGIKRDIVSLNKRMTQLIKKQPETAKIKGVKIYYIFLLDSHYDKKENFIDHSFLYNLSPDYSYIKKSLFRKKRYMRNNTLITDSLGNLIAVGDSKYLAFSHQGIFFELPEKKLAKMFFDKELDFAFFLVTPFSKSYMVGIKGNNLYGIEETEDGLKIYPWDEFVECCFDKWKH